MLQPTSLIGAGAASTASVAGASLREYVALKFLFTKSIPGHGDIFEEVSESELQPGDILLFPMDRSNDIVSRILFKHAAVYCGDGEVIHFQGAGTPNSTALISSQTTPGLISKQGYTALKKDRGNCQIYRKKGGVDLRAFRSRLRKAMNSEAEYSLYKNNCIHFALSLLGLEKFYSQLVQIQDEGGSSCSGRAVSILMSAPLAGVGVPGRNVGSKGGLSHQKNWVLNEGWVPLGCHGGRRRARGSQEGCGISQRALGSLGVLWVLSEGFGVPSRAVGPPAGLGSRCQCCQGTYLHGLGRAGQGLRGPSPFSRPSHAPPAGWGRGAATRREGWQPHVPGGWSPPTLSIAPRTPTTRPGKELFFGRVGDIAFCFLELNCHVLIRCFIKFCYLKCA
ncbi:uncharacterized protein LOC135580589 isoform X2 [Columba livia]|uniref:uncharacterized protein LOC135580589 isoform X2 n=1 Tax=Columba livia TaxID=8932 RepID=UPI0031B9B5A1